MKSIFKAAILVATIFTHKIENMGRPINHPAIADYGFAEWNNSKKPMEDRVIVEDQRAIGVNYENTVGDIVFAQIHTPIFAAIDGHGGYETAELVKNKLPELITQKSYDIKSAFKQMQEIIANSQATRGSGACISGFVLPNDTTARFFNCGDCRTLTVFQDDSFITSSDHTIWHDRERLDREGAVYGTLVDLQTKLFARHGYQAIFTPNPSNPDQHEGYICMARALGDIPNKSYSALNHVSHIPDHFDINVINNPIKFVFIASDGFWEKNTIPVAQLVALISNKISSGDSCTEIAESLKDTAISMNRAAGHKMDDISIILVKFNTHTIAKPAAAAPKD